MTPAETNLFSSPAGTRSLLRAFAASISLHLVVLALLICLPLSFAPEAQYTIIEIKPPLIRPQFAPRSQVQPEPQIIRAPFVFKDPRVTEPRAALKELKIPEERLAAKNTVETKSQMPEVAPSLTPFKAASFLPVVLTPAVKVGVFSGGTSAEALNHKPRELEASGFGDRSDIPRPLEARGEVAVVGAFDSPAEAGARLGVSRKSREIVVSTGFANNVASGDPDGFSSTGNSRGSVREGAFGDFHPVVNAVQPRPQSAKPVMIAAEVTSKPKPAYTKEARDLGLQGEVVLEVLLTASGDVRVLRVVRGLGHGLDEAAVRAAEQIRFKPAERDGRPVDSRSVVQIIFRLT